MPGAMQSTEPIKAPDGVMRAGELQYLLLSRRLRAFRSGATLALVPSIACILLLFFAFRESAPFTLLLGWVLLQLSQLGTFAILDRRMAQDAAELSHLQTFWRRIMVLQMVGSAIWMVVFPFLAIYASGQAAATLGVVGTAVLAGVLLVHRTAPRAGAFHIYALTPSLVATTYMLVGWDGLPIMALCVLFAAVLMIAIRVQERHFVKAAKAEIEFNEAAETVTLLLADYEEQSSEWLWTAGTRGNLRDPGAGLLHALGKSREEVEGKPLLALFQPGPECDLLARHLAEKSAFRDLVLKLEIGDELRYWRLSARPREDGRLSGVARDVTAETLVEERVAFMAHYDNLTGLANRHLFNERLRTLVWRPDMAGKHIALFYLDLDDFKAINDTRGHIAGDMLLREVAERLAREVRGEDLVARLGGDEFAVLIETRAGDSLLIERAHRFLSVVREPYDLDGQAYRISTSIGVARCDGGDCNAEELLRRADLALYAAKKKGRDKMALFEPSLDRAARDRRQLESDLSGALALDQLKLDYQPIIDLDNGKTTGFEALLRWQHPRRGLIAPDEFLHVAEETGLILEIGEWVIRQALTETSSWPGDFRIAINLSATQVKSKGLVEAVGRTIHDTRMAADRIELEITENVLLEESEQCLAALAKLRGLGVKIALDDFGTGYSSLQYIRCFPFDRIKIDRGFVENIVDDAGCQAIVSTITRLADSLGMETTAEGIETREQLDLLRKLGVQEAQGFLIARPQASPSTASDFDLAPVDGDSDDQQGAVVDYRKARKSALKRRGGKVA